MKQQVLSNKHMWGSISLLCCLVASEAPRAGRRRLSQVVWYQAGANMDYNGMKLSCGEELCTYDQLCPGGEPYTSPVGGQQADHDMWAPILPGPGEGTQNWVQVGTRASGGVALHTAV